MEKKVAIIILTCNRKELVEKCIISVNKNNYKKYKIFLTDDNSKDEIGKYIKKRFPQVDVTINKENRGYARSMNSAIRKSTAEYSPDYFLHFDDDTELIEKDCIKKMIEAAEVDQKIGILGCKLVYPEGNLQWFFKDGKMHFLRTKEKVLETKDTFQTRVVKDVIGACFLIRKEVVDEIGLYDEGFSPLYGEETDFCYRAGYKGFKMIYFGGTKAIHHGSASEKKLDEDGGKWYLQKEHAIRLEWLNLSMFYILRYTIVHFGATILSRTPLKKLKLLLKAYKKNLDNLSEIRQKRRERFSWKKI
jgi:GT2 family glycosyltransferase